MKSNYKPLGKYIQPVVGRNNDLGDWPLVGLSIQKKFIPSIANTIGTDMSTYRTIYKNQFAYSAVTSRNGDKLTIALFKDLEKGLISQAYTPFKITDTNKLLPDYLMMWFSRPEFDRYARFKSHGSARELFSWEELCETLIPVPHPDKQKEIVKEYNTIVNRITLNNQLINKLEETAQAIYKQWFVDFEFPNENGKPYKSNGGEMVESELGEIPKGWEVGELNDLITFRNGKLKPDTKGNFPVYGGNGIIEYVDDYNFENIIVIGRVGAYCGSLFRVEGKCWISDNAICAKSKCNLDMFGFHLLNNLKLNERSEGTGQPLLTQGILGSIKTVFPNEKVIKRFEYYSTLIFKKLLGKGNETALLENLKNLLLSKLATIEN